MGLHGGARAAPRRPDVLLVVGGVLIVLQTVVRALVVLPSYYWQDDFVHMDAAGRLGLSREFLVKDHNGHLEMGTNLVYWLIGRDAGPSFVPAALCLLAMQVVVSCLLLAVLRQLFGRSPWLLVPFAGYLFTPLGLPVATWWAAGMQAMPLQIAMLTALLGMIRAVRGPSWGWTALSAGGFALGLVFWEKAALVLPTVVAVLVLVEWAGEPLGRRLRLLAGAWRCLLPHVLLLAAYVPLYLSVVDSSAVIDLDRGDADSGDPVSALEGTVTRMLLPGLFGGPWTADGAENTLAADPGPGRAALFAVLALAVVVASLGLRGARALQGWLLVAGYLAVDLALVLVGRGDFLLLVARDPRYVTDALPVIAIGVCAAFSAPPRLRPVAHRSRSAIAALGAAVPLVAGCLVTTSLVAGELQHRQSRDYVDTVLQAMDDAPGVSVVSSRPPGRVSLYAEPDLAALLRAVGQDRRFDEPGTDVRMFDGQGVLRPITVLVPRLDVTGPAAGCGWLMGAGPQRLGELAWSGEGPEVLRVGYGTGVQATLHVAVGDDEQELALSPGVGQATFVVTGQQGPVEAWVTGAAPGAVCLDRAVVGTPWPEGAS